MKIKLKIIGVVVLLLFSAGFIKAQNPNNNVFYTLEINKMIKEFPDKLDLSSPLNSYVSFNYLKSKGKQNLYRNVNSFKILGFFPKNDAPDIEISNKKKESILDTKINELIIYKDSVAGIFIDYQNSMQIITYLTFEDGKWLNAGEGLGENIEDARAVFKVNAPKHLSNIYKINKLKETHSRNIDLVNYLNKNGKNPEQYILNELSQHRIVIYGELHRRKTSWDLMKKVANNSKFINKVGIVFMELSSDKQLALDNFFSSENLNTTILLDIFRDVQLNGWYDRGMYEYLIELWKINQTLPLKKKIKVVAVDEPRPFGIFKTYDELKNHFDNTLERNEQMAKIVLETLKRNEDSRNCLFIVGLGHAYKSTLNNIAIGGQVGKMKPTAASQIKNALTVKEVFTIFQHTPINNNSGTVMGELRNGIFDKAFSSVGNKTVAFDLKNSPFGNEPFDALYEVSYSGNIGTYSDNFDGYIFLEPLITESDEYLFNDIINEEYLKELKRRAQMLNTTVEKWFGVEKATVESLKKKIQYQPNENRWKTL